VRARYSAVCALSQDTIDLVNEITCLGCEMSVLDMLDADVAGRAKILGIQSVSAVAVNGVLASCCAGRGPNEATLRAARIGAG